MFNNNEQTWKDLKAFDTANEIHQQPQTWDKTYHIVLERRQEIQNFINQVINESEYDVIFTGAGTSEFVGNALAPVLVKEFNSNFKSIATTDIVATPALFIDPVKPTLLVSFGRSGNSPESIAAVDVVNEINKNAKHLVITCNHEGKLALRDDENIYSIKLPRETNDLSFAMTSSFSNMFLAAFLAFNTENLESLYPSIKDIIRVGYAFNEEGYKVAMELVENFKFDRIVYLGDADQNGFAQESALKMLELTAGEVVTMHNSPLGFRHGPKSIVNGTTLTVVYMKEDPYTRQYQVDIIKEMSPQRNGNQIMVVDTMNDDVIRELVDVYVSINYNEDTNKDLVGLNMVMYAQVLSLYKSLDLDKSPDNPWPSGLVNRVVQGVIIYPYSYEEEK
ncbi:SIS domain-containing protein [Erysipelothrix rhusiopathiae]|nr:SIS domain-containing protein [Erysipelothrix rhusiopathiae]MDE8340623.1 SIS domain-containing protein [Erysipelothrix rhusiopathiae]